MLDLSRQDELELDALISSIPSIQTLDKRPIVAEGKVSPILESAFDWIPNSDIEYYARYGRRESGDFDWSEYQGGLSGFYTPSGVLCTANLLCNAPDNIVPYIWVDSILRHIRNCYTYKLRGKSDILIYSIRNRLMDVIGERYRLHANTKYTIPLGLKYNKYVEDYVDSLKIHHFSHISTLDFVIDIVSYIIDNTIVIHDSTKYRGLV